MNALIQPIPASFGLARYDEMCHAIAECESVDEVKDIHDKARAVEIYLRQAGNLEAEMTAARIRIRAERRSGELIKELARNQTAGLKQGPLPNRATTEASEYASALERIGVSRQSASRYMALADVPEETFERFMNDPESRPTTSGIMAAARAYPNPVERVPIMSMRIWGEVTDFLRDGVPDASAAAILDAMLPSMRDRFWREFPAFIAFWRQFEEIQP